MFRQATFGQRLNRGFGGAFQRRPPLAARLGDECEHQLLSFGHVATLYSSFDLADDRLRHVPPWFEVGLYAQQVQQQAEVELPEGRIVNRSHPGGDSVRRVVGDTLDLQSLSVRARQLARVLARHERLVGVRRQHVGRPLPQLGKAVQLSQRALCGFVLRKIQQPRLPVEVRNEQLQGQRQSL